VNLYFYATAMIVYGFSMFLIGTMVEQTRTSGRMLTEWLNGFRDGWEAAEQFDNDVRIIWGGRND
jgi:hypothetical protein